MRSVRLAAVILIVALTACGRKAPPPRSASTPVAVQPAPLPAKPAWVARKVVADGVAIAGGTATVAPGETVERVAVRTRVPTGALLAANGLTARAPLVAGQVLKLPAGRVHTVHPGETGIAIARAYGVPWSKVVATNRLAAPFTIEIGDRLLLPSAVQVAAMSVEERAAAFRIDIDDLITGAQPATPAAPRRAPTVRKPPVSSTPPQAVVQALPSLGGGAPKFEWPLGGRVVSSFGAKPGGRFNDGVNLAASSGEPVRAAGDGVVAYAGDAVAGFGNLVLIKHSGDWVTAYGHNSALLVARGARVTRGQIIARAGATGAVAEPQLHFELRRGRTAVDPARLLPARG